MKHYTIRFGKQSKQSVSSRSSAAVNKQHDEKRIWARAALLALCGSIVCVSFLAYSVAPGRGPAAQGAVQVMARPTGGAPDSGDSDGGGVLPTVSENNSVSLWSYIEGVIRGIIGDAAD